MEGIFATCGRIAFFAYIVFEQVLGVVHPSGADKSDLTFIVFDQTRIAETRGRAWLREVGSRIGPHLHPLTGSAEELAAVVGVARRLLFGDKGVVRYIEAFAIGPDTTILPVIGTFHHTAVTKLIGFLGWSFGSHTGTENETSP